MKHDKIRKETPTEQLKPNIGQTAVDKKPNTTTINLPIAAQTKQPHFNFGKIPIVSPSNAIQTKQEETTTPKTRITAPSSPQQVPIQGKFLDLFRSQKSIRKRNERKAQQQQEDQRQLQYAQEFEHDLGFYLYNHPKAKAAASGAMEKMKQVMGVNQDPNKAPEAFGGDDPKYAGNVGKEIELVLDAINGGNLREKMTAFYNASLGPFKQMIEAHIRESKWEELQEKGIDDRGIEALKTRDRQRNSGKARFLSLFHRGIQDLYVAPLDSSVRSQQDALYQGNSIFSSKQSRQDVLSAPATDNMGLRINQDQQGNNYSASLRTNTDLKKLDYSAKLSPREKSLVKPELNKAKETFGQKYLPWEEGATRFKPNLNNKWVKEAAEKLKMPVKSGPSGTVDRMLQALQFLGNPVNPLDFRLALLGWMLTGNDHSFHEMMSVSSTYGLPYEPGLNAYHHIAPLTINELRENVCKKVKIGDVYAKLFPDERLYHNKFHNKPQLLGYTNDIDLVNDEADPWKIQARNNQEQKELELLSTTGSAAGFAAIKTYTGGAYLLQNTEMSSYPNWIKKRIIKNHIKNRNNYEISNLRQKYRQKDVTLKDIRKEAKIHNQMLKTALKDMPLWEGTVYRGEVASKNTYNKGKTIEYNKFTSTTQELDVAKSFMASSSIKNRRKTPFLLIMNVKYGRDVNLFSKQKDREKEILLPPKAVFKVIDNPRLDKLDNGNSYYLVTLEQISAGEYETKYSEHQDYYEYKEQQKQQDKNKQNNRKNLQPLSQLEFPQFDEDEEEPLLASSKNKKSWVPYLSNDPQPKSNYGSHISIIDDY